MMICSLNYRLLSKVYGIENLRIADGSIMPGVTTGNTMAPCVVIGERAAEILKARHKL
jgi:choline dehydrogenase